MADLNTVYSGVVEYFDPKGDSGIKNLSTVSWLGTGGSNYWLDEMPFWSELDAINKGSASTIAAVKVAYVTGQDRTQWLSDRLTAINNRVSFIQGRVTQLLNTMQAAGTSGYDVAMKAYTAALSLVPVVGTAINYFAGKATTAQALEQYKLQQLVLSYAADLNQLAEIRTQLATEYKTATGNDPTSNAPSVSTWYWLAGAGLLVLLFVWYRKRKKRRKR